MIIRYKKLKYILILTLVLVTTAISAGCATYDRYVEFLQGEAEAEEVILIGVFEPLSGVDEEAAADELKGIELAHELCPKVLGKKVELVYADNKSDIAVAETAAQELIDKEVSVILGSYGNTLSLAGGEYFKEAKIPAIAITCTNPILTQPNPYYFRVCIVDSFQGHMAAKFVHNDLETDKAAVMKASDDDFGAALSQQFTDGLSGLTEGEDLFIPIVEYKRGATDFKNQLEVVKTADPDVIYLPGTAEEAVAIVKQARSEGIDSFFLGTDLWYRDTLIQEGGEDVEGLVFTTFFDAESTLTEKTEEFTEAYHKKFGEDEQPDSAAALGYDAYMLALDAIRRHAEINEGNEITGGGISLRDVIQDTRQFRGATGEITFNEAGDPIKPVVFITIKNGEFIYKYTAEPEWN